MAGISSWQVLSLVVPESVKYGVYVQLSRPLGLCVILARLFLANPKWFEYQAGWSGVSVKRVLAWSQ